MKTHRAVHMYMSIISILIIIFGKKDTKILASGKDFVTIQIPRYEISGENSR